MMKFRCFANGTCLLCLLVALAGLLGCRQDQTDLSASELLETGWNHYRLGVFDQATRSFDQALLLTESGTPEYDEALYALATTWNLRRPGEDRDRATEIYQQIINTHPDSETAGWSSLALARMQHLIPVGTEPDYDQVRTAYQNVMSSYPNHPAAQEATIYLYSTYVATMAPADAEKALTGLKQFVADYPDSGFLSAAYGLMSECYNTLQRPNDEFQNKLRSFKTREVDVTNPFYDNSWRYWNIAASAEFEAGDFDTARKYYALLIEEYPQDIRVYASKQAIRRMNRIEEQLRREIEAERR